MNTPKKVFNVKRMVKFFEAPSVKELEELVNIEINSNNFPIREIKYQHSMTDSDRGNKRNCSAMVFYDITNVLKKIVK